MATYIGYFLPSSDYATANSARVRAEGPGPDPKFIERIVSLPAALPPGTRMVGTWSPMNSGPVFAGQPLPGFTIVETDDVAGLAVINNHYAGYLNFQWSPANVLPPSTAGRQQWQKDQEAQASWRGWPRAGRSIHASRSACTRAANGSVAGVRSVVLRTSR